MTKVIVYIMVFIGIIMGAIYLLEILMESNLFIILFVLFLLYGVVSTIYDGLKYCFRLLVGHHPESEETLVAEEQTSSIIPIESLEKKLEETEECSQPLGSVEFNRVDERWGYIQGEQRRYRLFNTGVWKFGFRIEALVSNDYGNSVDVIDILLDGKSQLISWLLEENTTDKDFLDFVMTKLWNLAYREKIGFSNIKELDEFLEEVAFNKYLLQEGLISQIESEEDMKVEYQWVS